MSGLPPPLPPTCWATKWQLRLFDNLVALVDGLLAGAEPAVTEVGGASADVQVQLPALLALYRRLPGAT